MKVTGSATLAAPPSQVWDALQDPAVLVRTIPGCSRLETIGVDEYAMTISAGVASIKGTYAGEVALAEPDPPHSFVLRAKGQGAPGTVDAVVRVRLTPDEAAGGGHTRIDYDADAVVGGMIGGVGQRMLSTVAKRTAGEFFAAVERTLQAEPNGVRSLEPDTVRPPEPDTVRPPEPDTVRPQEPDAVRQPDAARAAQSTGQAPEHRVYTAPAPARTADRNAAVPWAMTAAFGAGGAIALAGVALGFFMGRRTRR